MPEASAAAVVRKTMMNFAPKVRRTYIRVSRDRGRGHESWNDSIFGEGKGL